MPTRILFGILVTAWLPSHAFSAPNVLLIISDDQGYGDLSIHGNPHLKTPNIDRIGSEGVRFDRFFVNSFCAPTRAALLTGRWPLRTGVHGVTHNREAMKPSETTMAEVFRNSGYRTACIGKWHNGEQYPYTPSGQGFDRFFGFTGGHWNNYFAPMLLDDNKNVSTTGYIADVLTDEALRFVDADASKPFFCYLAYNTPHSPYQVSDAYYERFRSLGLDETVSTFYGMCSNLDDNVGRLLQHLEDRKLVDDTIILFLTDNGGTAGVKIYNAGMRGGKTSVHEGGSRVPLFVCWPQAGWTPHEVKPLTSHIDILPTLMDLCELRPVDGPKMDGVSLRPLLEGHAENWSERTLFTHNPIDETNKYPGAVRTEQYRLVREIKGAAGGSKAKANDRSASDWQLYDMQIDPGQEKNLASDRPDIVAELSAEYDAWFADISRDGLKRFPLPVGYSEQNPIELHAPQAYFDAPLSFASGPGFANDWLTGWNDPSARLWFEIDVATAGEYEIAVDYVCPKVDAGSEIQIAVGEQSLSCVVPVAEALEVDLPHRDAKGKAAYRNRVWSTLIAGKLKLSAGRARLTIQPKSMPGSQVMDFKHVRLERIPSGLSN